MIEVRFSVADEGNWLTGIGAEWSIQGVFVQSRQIFPPGTPVTLAFTPSGERLPIIVRGQVTWARTAGTSGMGVVFGDLPDEMAARIEKLSSPRSSRRSSRRPTR